MAPSKVSQIPQKSTFQHHPTNSKLKSIKEVVESPNLTSIPPNYVYFTNPIESTVDHLDLKHDYPVPVIDFSLLESDFPDQRSKVVQDLGKACQDWGFFMVVNHGVQESLMKAMIDKCNEFFDLTVEEKQEFEGKHVSDPIRYGTSFNASLEKVNLWKDYLRVIVHPQFHSPTKPHHFSETSSEYSKEVRRVARVLLRGISTSLGLDELEIEKSLNLNMGQQVLIANYYPPCPEPNLAIGMAAHSDHGLLTLLAQNQVCGLQIQHDGKWVSINALPNSFLVNVADHLEILSNGKYKSVMHRAIVNNMATRISLVVTNGPSLDTIVRPATQLINAEKGVHANYKPMMYKEYQFHLQNKQLDGKSHFDIVLV